MNLVKKQFCSFVYGQRQLHSDINNWNKIQNYKWFLPIQTRWKDNDQYGHVNNAVFQSYFDTVANLYLIRHCGLRTFQKDSADPIAFVVECNCQFFKPILYPNVYLVGMSLAHLGNSSLRYKLAVFSLRNQDEKTPLDFVQGYFTQDNPPPDLFENEANAVGQFVHVTVDPATNSPVRVPMRWRDNLEKIKC